MTIVYRSNNQPATTRANMTSQNIGTSLSTSVSDDMDKAEFWSSEEASLYESWSSAFFDYNLSYSSPYFDYFFSGHDTDIKIEGLSTAANELVITSFAYNVEQQKQPVYGFWNYTYSAMLRGTRIVTGAFSVASNGPITMTKMLAKAASVRANIALNPAGRSINALRGIEEDEANIEKYWGKHYDSNLESRQQHLFSIHPPFNFVIRYGLQETSLVANNPNARVDEFRLKYNEESVMATDYNERLVRHPSEQEDFKVLIENVELVSKQMQFDTSGDPIAEIYTFMARDERILSGALYTDPTEIQSTGIDEPAGPIENGVGDIEYED